jgi:hypothetical protein
MPLCECTNCGWTGDPSELKEYDCPKCEDSVFFFVVDTAEHIDFLRGEINRLTGSRPLYSGASHR